MTNLIEGIQQKCNYIRDTIIPQYEAIGPAARFGKIMLQEDIRKGEAAISSDDIVQMLQVYKELEETCKRAL